MKTDDEEQIRKRAYELWERAGWPEGDGLTALRFSGFASSGCFIAVDLLAFFALETAAVSPAIVAFSCIPFPLIFAD